MAASLLIGCSKEKRAGEVPSLSLPTSSGETFALSAQDKKVTLIVFWATWCRPCLMEIPGLVELQKRYGDRGFRVVGVNIDDPKGDKTRTIMEHFHINYPVLMGGDETGQRFGGIYGIPTAFLVGRDGLIKEKIEGMAPMEMLEEKILAQL